MKLHYTSLLMLLLFFVGCEESIGTSTRDIARLERIDARFKAGELDYALRETTKYTAEYPSCDQGWCLRGWTHAKLDELDAAVDSFERAIELNPRNDNAYVGLGVIHRKEGNLGAARDAYSQAIQILPNNAEAFSSLLVIEILEGNYEKAVEYGEKAWALRKDLPSIPANLAIAYHYVGNEARKQHYYNEAKRLEYHQLDLVEQIFDGTLAIE